MTPISKSLAALLASTLAAAFVMMATPSLRAEEPAPRLTVTGHGEAGARPDLAVFAVGVENQAASAQTALEANSIAITKVIERLAAAGIEERDMQTTSLGLWPVYAEQRDGEQPPETVGYRVGNQVQVRLRAIERLGALLDEAVGDGANSLSGPSFTVAEPAPLIEKARDLAVADAMAKAKRYAAAAGVALGRVVSIEEARTAEPIAYRMQAESLSAAVPVAAGESSFSAEVTMVFAIE